NFRSLFPQGRRRPDPFPLRRPRQDRRSHRPPKQRRRCLAQNEVNCLPLFLMIAERDVTVWIISALLAIGIGWSRYAKWRTREKIVRELAAMDPDRREKMLNRMNPRLAMEMREQLMK